MKIAYCPSKSDYESYYLKQVGFGGIPVYRGLATQRGYGLGNILSSAFRYAAPLLKNGASYLGKKLLSTGAKVAADVVSGIPIKTALKTHSINAGRETLASAVDEAKMLTASAADHIKRMTGSGNKRKRTRSKNIISAATRIGKRPFPQRSDIFS